MIWTNSSIIPDAIDDEDKRIFQLKYIKYCTERENYVREHNLKFYTYYEYGTNNLSVDNLPIDVYFNGEKFYCVTTNYDTNPVFNVFQNEHILERFTNKDQFNNYFINNSEVISNITKF
jgi:hypothetical protein